MTKYTVHPDLDIKDGFMTLNHNNDSFIFSNDIRIVNEFTIYQEFKEKRMLIDDLNFMQWAEKYWPVTLMTFYE